MLLDGWMDGTKKLPVASNELSRIVLPQLLFCSCSCSCSCLVVECAWLVSWLVGWGVCLFVCFFCCCVSPPLSVFSRNGISTRGVGWDVRDVTVSCSLAFNQPTPRRG